MKVKKSKTLFLFYLLFAYVLLQFVWWAFLMVQLNNESYTLHLQLLERNTYADAERQIQQAELLQKLRKRTMMVAGEGSVFLTLILYGVLRVRNAFRREQDLAEGQKNFLLSTTHELKSPIASLKLQLETIVYRKPGAELEKKVLMNALEDIERLNALSEKVLLAARIESAAYELHREYLDLSELFENLLNKKAPHAKHKFVKHIASNLQLFADRLALESIINNLLENAEKYSDPGTEIEITAQKEGNNTVVVIKDQGCGIANEEKSRIFDVFYRVGREETRKSAGTGLGLFIVSYLTKMHGGDIKVKDNLPKGTVMELRF